MRRAHVWMSLLALVGCHGDGDLRGRSTPSADGRTYLVVDDDNGGQCGPLTVDGKPWPHPIGAPGPVAPGPHVVACGADFTVRVDSGQTYRFDYWGP